MKTLFIIIFIFLFTGCLSITQELPAFKTYTISLNESLKISKQTNKTIKVYEPKSLNSLNNKSIIYKKENQQESYSLNRWSDKPSLMLQKIILDNLNKQAYFSQISSSKITIKSDYSLKSELIAFNQVFKNNKAFVEFSILVYLVKDKTLYKTFSYTNEVNTLDAKGAVNGLNKVSNLFIKDLNSWLLANTK